MEIILAADEKSPYYNEEIQRLEPFHNQGWALVHMLMTRDPYRSRFWK